MSKPSTPILTSPTKSSKPHPDEGMVIIGVDPGLRATGYGIVIWTKNDQLRLIEAGVIRPKTAVSLPQRLFAIHQCLENVFSEHKPSVMVLETLFAHPRHPRTVSILGHVRGIICLAAAQWGMTVHELSPKRVRVSLIGRGAAAKQQIRRSVADLFAVEEKNLTLDASDALALVVGWVRMNGRSNNAFSSCRVSNGGIARILT